MTVRTSAVGGLFYPADAAELASVVDSLLDEARDVDSSGAAAKALIVPHAGYVYSGPVAATAYRALRARRHDITRVVLLGPAHRVALDGLAVPSVDAFRTPLGDVPIDVAARDEIATLPAVRVDDHPHADEHSLEVQLPFLQRVLGDFTIVPIVVGQATIDDTARVVDALWGGPETLLVVSSDLSHYENHTSATEHDRRTADAITAGTVDAIGPYDACGAYPLRGLLAVARRRGCLPSVLDLRTSGDTAGSRDRVVGYGAFSLAGAAS